MLPMQFRHGRTHRTGHFEAGEPYRDIPHVATLYGGVRPDGSHIEYHVYSTLTVVRRVANSVVFDNQSYVTISERDGAPSVSFRDGELIVTNNEGQPVINYTMTPYDQPSVFD